MKELKTYEVGSDLGTLQRSCETGYPPAGLEAAFRAMVTEIASKTREKPFSVYLCSPDSSAEARDRFAFLLVKLVRDHVPTALLVDCAFLSTGLSGIVPHRDALGFLDLLLYGTSMGVITQESAHGVKVVGAGSFTVTKKSPFVMDAFASARRYLAHQAKCVVFVGPATDDEDKLHPLAANVDLAVLVRAGDRFGARALDPLEEGLASVEGVEKWSVRINTRASGGEPRAAVAEFRSAEETPPAARMEPELVSEIDGLVEIGAGRAAQEPPALPERPVPAASAPSRIGGTGADAGIGERGRFREGKKSGSPRFIRTVAVIVSVALVAFVMWWLYLTRTVRDGEERTAVPGPPGAPAAGPVTSADSLAAAAAARDRVESLIARGWNTTRSSDGGGSLAEPEALAAETGGGAGPAAGAGEAPRAEALGTRPPSASDDIHVAESLGEFADQYVVHVSSFKGIDKAREEARDLLGWGYPVFIYRVDLGTKGMWHRVYVGPYGSRDAAMEHKIKLDENPRIKSTRISKVPG